MGMVNGTSFQDMRFNVSEENRSSEASNDTNKHLLLGPTYLHVKWCTKSKPFLLINGQSSAPLIARIRNRDLHFFSYVYTSLQTPVDASGNDPGSQLSRSGGYSDMGHAQSRSSSQSCPFSSLQQLVTPPSSPPSHLQQVHEEVEFPLAPPPRPSSRRVTTRVQNGNAGDGLLSIIPTNHIELDNTILDELSLDQQFTALCEEDKEQEKQEPRRRVSLYISLPKVSVVILQQLSAPFTNHFYSEPLVKLQLDQFEMISTIHPMMNPVTVNNDPSPNSTAENDPHWELICSHCTLHGFQVVDLLTSKCESHILLDISPALHTHTCCEPGKKRAQLTINCRNLTFTAEHRPIRLLLNFLHDLEHYGVDDIPLVHEESFHQDCDTHLDKVDPSLSTSFGFLWSVQFSSEKCEILLVSDERFEVSNRPTLQWLLRHLCVSSVCTDPHISVSMTATALVGKGHRHLVPMIEQTLVKMMVPLNNDMTKHQNEGHVIYVEAATLRFSAQLSWIFFSVIQVCICHETTRCPWMNKILLLLTEHFIPFSVVFSSDRYVLFASI